MGRIDGAEGDLERCETGANPLEIRGKRKPVTPENDPRETGLSFLNGGGAENRTPVQQGPIWQHYEHSPCFFFGGKAPKDRILLPYSPLESRNAIRRRYRESSRLCDAHSGSDDRAPKERGCLIKQPVRNLRWQLLFWSLIYEDTPASARSPKPSILPSKPVAPLSFRALQS